MTVDEISIQISASAEQAIAQLDKVSGKLSALAGGGAFSLKLDTAQAEERLQALRQSANQLITDLNGNSVTATALAQQQRSYKGAISELQTLKGLSRTTYEQELAYLLAIRDGMTRFSLSAKNALDLEQRLADVQAQIAARDAQNLDTLLSGVMTALSNRYEAMRDSELDMLTQSRESWQTWRESSAGAVQAQIDALDDLARAEDRASQESGYQRRIEKLTQALQYEQDSFNKGQLAAQLEAAQADYDAWQSQTAREDQKAALQEQLSDIDAKAQAELDALAAQEDAVNSAYAQQLQDASLRAEAEKQLMQGTQEEILALITAFAPDYNATGQTLGEQLLAGFAQQTGGVADWMETLNGLILGVQQSLSNTLQNATDSFYQEHTNPVSTGVTIHQQNTFNSPVETPSETVWRIRQANEQLAAELLES